MAKKRNPQIRNSTAEFLVFTSQSGENTTEVRVQDETVWLTQKAMAKDFDGSEFEKYRIVQDRLFESDFDQDISWQIIKSLPLNKKIMKYE